MDERMTIPMAAKLINRTPAALYTAAKNGQLETSEEYGRMLVTLKETMRYQRETKVGRKPESNGRKKR